MATQLELFFDGDCPLCSREVAFIRRRDRAQEILFTDISSPDFDAAQLGKTREILMARIHARLPDSTWITGVEVFRRLYAIIGFRRAVTVSRWPIISQLLDVFYSLFARSRLRLTGRCSANQCKVPSPQRHS